ncbi:MAG: MCE family protein [Actinobacteria bacterium]|nr:MCE family protein [Actinomycetota bacterium]
MRGISTRVGINLVWLIVFSVGAIVLAFLTFASGVVFDDSYRISVPMPETGGVLPDQEVTVLGRAVGQVEEVELTDEGVLMHLSIQGDKVVPSEARVQVLRRSPIGEQAVDFQPEEPGWEPAERGATVTPTEAVVPAEVPFLLEQTVELFRAIAPEDVTTFFEELALAVDDRGQTLKQLGRDSRDLNATLVAGIPEFERAIESSTIVLDTLQEHRFALADVFVNGADLTEVFAEQQPTIDRLLTTGNRALVQGDAFIRNERANFTCLTRDFTDVNEMLLGPSTHTGVNAGRYESKLDEAEHALMRAHWFFQDGFDVLTQWDPLTGAPWQRILMVGPPEEGRAYPQKRATPATTPGAACQSRFFGTGVNAVRQDDPQPPDETSPGIDYAPLVAQQGGSDVDPPPGGDARGGSGPLPATGGGLALLGPIVLGTALWLRRRS